MSVEWSAPFTLTSPQGSLDLSDDTGYLFLPDQCQAGVDLRITKDAIPQADGEIFHRRFKTGYTMRIALQLMDGGGPAFGATLVSMWDDLLLHLDALLNPSLAELVSSCRIQWTPSGSSDDWMLDRVRLLERPTPTGVLPKIATFALDTELPYTMLVDETTTALADGVTSVLTNTGTTAFLPVFKVYGPTSGFTIVNADALDANGNPLQIVYDDSLPGANAIAGGHYVEINCFRNTVVLDGNAAFYLAGIDIPASDLNLPLLPGDNHLTITGAGADVLWQPAKA